jgi:hypothetical protein
MSSVHPDPPADRRTRVVLRGCSSRIAPAVDTGPWPAPGIPGRSSARAAVRAALARMVKVRIGRFGRAANVRAAPAD